MTSNYLARYEIAASKIRKKDIYHKADAVELRACLETHLSIMKRFNSMLAMAI